MHELSIVLSIIDIAEEAARQAGAHNVERIELEIGQLAGVQVDALEFAWDAAVKNTILQKAERLIHHVNGKARCTTCGTEFLMQQLYDACPKCNAYFSEILQGQELRVKAITIN
ncbi:MAG: hydrogenase maturation nickel metallochaperone HypA [Saprospiraceae bacterium]